MGDFRASLDQNDVKASERTSLVRKSLPDTTLETWGDHLGAKLAAYCYCGHQFGHFYGILSPHHSVESLVKS